MSRGRRLAERIGLFCADYWNADGSIRAPTEEESRQEDVAYAQHLAVFDALTPEQMDALEAEADEDDAAIGRLECAWDNPSRGLPVPTRGRPEHADEALRLAKQKRAKVG